MSSNPAALARHVLACVNGAADRTAILDAVPPSHGVTFFSETRDLVSAAILRPPAATILELDGESASDVTLGVAELAKCPLRLPILLPTKLDRIAAAAIGDIARTTTHVTIGLSGFDEIGASLRALVGLRSQRPATLRIIRTLPLPRKSREQLIVTAAVLLGCKHASVPTLAAACGSSTRNLQLFLTRRQLPPPKQLLGWALALHTVWSLEVESRTLKDVAAQAEFSSPEALANCVERHVGSRPVRILREAGFEHLLERFVSTMAPKRPDPRTPMEAH